MDRYKVTWIDRMRVRQLNRSLLDRQKEINSLIGKKISGQIVKWIEKVSWIDRKF